MADARDAAASKTLCIIQISTAQSFAGKRRSWRFEWLPLTIFPKAKAHARPLSLRAIKVAGRQREKITLTFDGGEGSNLQEWEG
jgi:hypothetical protein